MSHEDYYKTSQRLQLNCSVVRSETAKNRPGVSKYTKKKDKVQNSRKAIRVTKMPMTTRYMIPYLIIYIMFLLSNISMGYQENSHNPAALSFLLYRIQRCPYLF